MRVTLTLTLTLRLKKKDALHVSDQGGVLTDPTETTSSLSESTGPRGYENALCRHFGDVAPMDDPPYDIDDCIRFSSAFQKMCMQRFRVSREGDHMGAYNTFAMRRFVNAVDEGRARIANATQQQEYDMAKREMLKLAGA